MTKAEIIEKINQTESQFLLDRISDLLSHNPTLPREPAPEDLGRVLDETREQIKDGFFFTEEEVKARYGL